MSNNPIDQDVIKELQEATGTEFVAELVTTFLEEAPQMIADLKEAAGQEDEDRIRRAAHSIKSNANVFGASALAQVARDIELDGLEAGMAEDNADLAALEAEYTRASAALRVLLDG